MSFTEKKSVITSENEEPSCSVSIEQGQHKFQDSSLVAMSIKRNTYEPTPKKSRSEQKLRPFHQDNVSAKLSESVYTIIDISILEEMIEKSCICKICKAGSLVVESKGKFGVVDKLNFECSNTECRTRNIFFSSRRSKLERISSSQGQKPFALNIRFVPSMRLIGKGHKAINLFCGLINVSNGMCQDSFENLQVLIENKSLDIAQQSMKNAAEDVRASSETHDKVVDTTCMFDGTWQHRGYSSLISSVTCLSAVNNIVIDIEMLRKICKFCQRLSKMEPTSDKYEELKRNHACQKNYIGSAPGMELTGVKRIYSKSITERSLRYTKYVGDCDSKSYDSI